MRKIIKRRGLNVSPCMVPLYIRNLLCFAKVFPGECCVEL